MPTTEEMEQLTEAINAAVPEIRVGGVPTVRGWIQRLLDAGIAYGRGPETAARWEELMAIKRQAEAFFRQLEER